MEPKELMDVKQVAAFWGVHPRTVFRWVELGRIKAVRMPSGRARFKRVEVIRAMDIYEFEPGQPNHDPSMG